MGTVHRDPRGRKACTKLGAAWFPMAAIYDTAITTPVPCSLQYDTLHLGLGRPDPQLASVCRSSLLQDVPNTPVTATRDPGYGSPRNPEVRTRDWIYGRQFYAISNTNLRDINTNNINVIISKVISVKLLEKVYMLSEIYMIPLYKIRLR
jgi:hypothetical protein